jgi:hypothetical protein
MIKIKKKVTQILKKNFKNLKKKKKIIFKFVLFIYIYIGFF